MLKLVPLGARHAFDLAALAGDDPAPPWMTADQRSPAQKVLAFVARAQWLHARGARETFAVFGTERLLLGIVMLGRDPAASDRAEMGYWIGPPNRGHGYATAASRQLLTHGFGRMKLALVFARCPSANPASTRVVEKLGFRFVGLEPALERPESMGEPIRRYEMTRDEWLER